MKDALFRNWKWTGLALVLNLACPGLLSREPNALERFYQWPPSPEFPTTDHDQFWDWDAAPVGDLPDSPALDLRGLNEATAGRHGWVTRQGDKLQLGDGTPVRFWAMNTTGNAPLDQLEWFSAQLARRGVNMIRIHGGASKTMLDMEADHLFATNDSVVDQMHKAVVAAKKEGIYTFVSNTLFIIQFKIKASYGLAGYTQEWLDANPENHVPFGLLFFNDKLKAAFRHWVHTLATAPNPYDPDHTPLAQDPAVAIFEIQNEDNLFFWTFRPERWPKAQRDRAGRQFFEWVAKTHGRFGETDKEAVSRVLANWRRPMPEDSLAEGILALGSAADMAQRDRGSERWGAQIRFLGEVQRDFYEGVTAMLREAGFGGLVSSGNWKTANEVKLLDHERYSYTANEVLGVNRYVTGVHVNPNEGHKAGYLVSRGDYFTSHSKLLHPRGLATNIKQVPGHPMIIPESTWVPPLGYQSEAPFLVAAYSSLIGVDVYYWFALGDVGYDKTIKKWQAANPSMMGGWPAAALAFRKGYIQKGEAVVREERALGDMWQLATPIIAEDRSFDPNRDAGSIGKLSNIKEGVDPLAFLAGPVEVVYAEKPAESRVADLSKLIDHSVKTIASVTGELKLDYGTGLCTLNAPKAQGVTGFLKKAGTVALGNLTVEANNDFATVLAVSLDGKDLKDASKVLVQITTQCRPYGWRASPATFKSKDKKQTFQGYRIDDTGASPWNVVNTDMSVTLANRRLKKATLLDINGYPVADRAVKVESAPGGIRVTPPADAMYIVLH